MRDFDLFNSGENSLCVRNNQIELSIRITAKLGPGTASPSFNGEIIAGLSFPELPVYKSAKQKQEINTRHRSPASLFYDGKYGCRMFDNNIK